ncbi:Fe-S cluster assembly protein SufD [Bartonella sp. DGB2]|uniref:Fe-S cluster assembly protein SufD n=1 Tax=Bartonella sp. DGB2 TaxID=3388426 RepID=UPI00398F9061
MSNQSPHLTLAETVLMDQIAKGNALHPKQGAARHLLKQYGIPSRKREYWHYTDLRVLLNTIPVWAVGGESSTTIAPFLKESFVVPSHNGIPIPVKKGAYFEAKPLKGAALAPYLPDELKREDFIGQFNSAFVTEGQDIILRAGAPVVLELQNTYASGQSHGFTHVTCQSNSRAMIIERYCSASGARLLTSQTKLSLEEGSVVDWIIIADSVEGGVELRKLNARLAKDAQLNLYFINQARAISRHEINVVLVAAGADFQLRALNLLAERSHSDLTTTIEHMARGTTSRELVRNVVTDSAYGAFQGLIKVAKEAQKTDARMACNSLLLSDKATFNTKPELEIFADDVACAHGATFSDINEDHLFYLLARGIDESTARSLLVKAFMAELLDTMKETRMRSILENKVETWLTRYV